MPREQFPSGAPHDKVPDSVPEDFRKDIERIMQDKPLPAPPEIKKKKRKPTEPKVPTSWQTKVLRAVVAGAGLLAATPEIKESTRPEIKQESTDVSPDTKTQSPQSILESLPKQVTRESTKKVPTFEPGQAMAATTEDVPAPESPRGTRLVSLSEHITLSELPPRTSEYLPITGREGVVDLRANLRALWAKESAWAKQQYESERRSRLSQSTHPKYSEEEFLEKLREEVTQLKSAVRGLSRIASGADAKAREMTAAKAREVEELHEKLTERLQEKQMELERRESLNSIEGRMKSVIRDAQELAEDVALEARSDDAYLAVLSEPLLKTYRALEQSKRLTYPTTEALEAEFTEVVESVFAHLSWDVIAHKYRLSKEEVLKLQRLPSTPKFHAQALVKSFYESRLPLTKTLNIEAGESGSLAIVETVDDEKQKQAAEEIIQIGGIESLLLSPIPETRGAYGYFTFSATEDAMKEIELLNSELPPTLRYKERREGEVPRLEDDVTHKTLELLYGEIVALKEPTKNF